MVPVLPHWRAFKARACPRARLGSPASLDYSRGSTARLVAINATRVSLDTALASFTRRTQTQTAKKRPLVKSDVHLCPLAASASASLASARRKTRAGSSIIRFHLWVFESSSFLRIEPERGARILPLPWKKTKTELSKHLFINPVRFAPVCPRWNNVNASLVIDDGGWEFFSLRYVSEGRWRRGE